MVAIEIARAGGQRSAELVIVEPRPELGRGVAYSTTDPLHLLNVPAGAMSAIESEPDHLRDWIRSRGLERPEPHFLPRLEYGRYLAETLDEHLRGHRAGVRIVRDRVRSLTLDRNGSPTVVTEDGVTFDLDEAVIATGTGPVREPAAVSSELRLSGRYDAEPWGYGATERIRDGETVLLIGSGLTMVDVALSIDAARRGVRMISVSRSGLMPLGHGPGRPRVAAPFPLPDSDVRIATVIGEFFAALGRERARGGDAADVIDSMRPVTQQIWRALPQTDRAWFLRHLRRLWEVHRHRMAPEVARRIDALCRCGALQVRRGDLTRLELNGDRVLVTVEDADGARTIGADHVVNCAGPEDDPTRAAREPLRGMLLDGTARADELGLGIEVTPEGAVVGARDQVAPRLHTIGALRKGSLWESTAIPEIRRQAAQISERILSRDRGEVVAA